MYNHFLKRYFDVLISLIGIVLLSPIILIVILILFFTYRESPFFLQARSGMHGRIFRIIKFKTMNDKRDKQGNLLPDVKRLTPVGRFIRKTSIDELPQLINVLKGDLSLVGPRPLLIEYLPLYNKEQSRRHELKPGITGWAQVNGRNAISWKEKFELDVWYVDHLSFQFDVKILILTFIMVFKTENVDNSETTTMDRFTGNN